MHPEGADQHSLGRDEQQREEPLVQEDLSVRARLHQEQERHHQANARVMERRQELAGQC